jgi:hypothetical protein
LAVRLRSIFFLTLEIYWYNSSMDLLYDCLGQVLHSFIKFYL